MIKSTLLVLKGRTQFHGQTIGAIGSAAREVVFNTPMTGHQEILTDPSYSRQIVILTYPYIGNVDTNNADEESSQVHAQGLVTRDLPLTASNSRNTEGLSSYPKRHSIVAITDTNTRKLTRLLHEKDTQNGCITVGDNPGAVLTLEKARAFSGLDGMDLAKEVTTAEAYSQTQGSRTLADGLPGARKENELLLRVVTYNFDTKRSILQVLVDRGCHPTIVPVQTSAEDVLKMNPDGIFLSSGPGDPAPRDRAVTAIQKSLEADIPVFDTCLGHRLLTLASDAETVKMKFGHHDGNRPVKNMEKNVAMITAQNRGFAVGEATLPTDLRVMHKSLFDGTLQGIRRTDKPVFGFQDHLEVSPESHDAAPLSDHFIELIEQYRRITK